MTPHRPPVSVVVPFLGTAAEGGELLKALERLALRAGDEVIVVDNAPTPTSLPANRASARIVHAPDRRSSYHARNVGAAAGANEWLLFVDADTRPDPDILDRYFDAGVEPDCGICAGEVDPDPDQTALAARHMRSRGHLKVESFSDSGPHPAGATANLLVRRRAWAQLGGFFELRSGADLEFCWRAHRIGWRLEQRPAARVTHLHSERIGSMLRKARRYGPGQAWLSRRYGHPDRPPLLRQVGRSAAGVVAWTLTARFERAAFKLLDGLWVSAYSIGYYLGDNRPAGGEAIDGAGRPVAVLVARCFGDADDRRPVERAQVLQREGLAVMVISARRPARAELRAGEGLCVTYLEDEPSGGRWAALLRLAGRHPQRWLAAWIRRWRTGAGGDDRQGSGPNRREPGLAALAAAAGRIATADLRIEAVDWPAAAEQLAAMVGQRTSQRSLD